MTREFQQIAPRYHRDWCQTDEERAEARAGVKTAMDALFRRQPYTADSEDGAGWTSGIGGSGNGMPSTAMTPAESPAWRRRIEKARMEIAERQSEIRVRELAESITIEELQNDLLEIRRWVNSLKRTAI